MHVAVCICGKLQITLEWFDHYIHFYGDSGLSGQYITNPQLNERDQLTNNIASPIKIW